MIEIYFFDNVHINEDGKIAEPMSENKRKRDANGRFVKSTEPKKQEAKKSPCVKPDYEKMYNALNSAYKYALEEKRILECKLRARDVEDDAKAEAFWTAISNQRAITTEIILQLNWFQRRRLRKILAQYPDKIHGYYMEKDV